jgi:uncharacterized protein YkwD
VKALFARVAVVTALVAAVAVLAVGAGGATAAGDPARTIAAEDQLETQILAALNAMRRAHGLVPLKLSRTLSAAADAHSRSMGTYGFFGHETRSGLGLRERVGRAPYYYGRGQRWAAGENLLWASPSLEAPEAMEVWMDSPFHRQNILRPLWREIGISAVSVQHAPGIFEGNTVVIVTTTFGVRF